MRTSSTIKWIVLPPLAVMLVVLVCAVPQYLSMPQPPALVYKPEINELARGQALDIPPDALGTAKEELRQARNACKAAAQNTAKQHGALGEGTWSLLDKTITINDTLKPPVNLAYTCTYNLDTDAVAVADIKKK